MGSPHRHLHGFCLAAAGNDLEDFRDSEQPDDQRNEAEASHQIDIIECKPSGAENKIHAYCCHE